MYSIIDLIGFIFTTLYSTLLYSRTFCLGVVVGFVITNQLIQTKEERDVNEFENQMKTRKEKNRLKSQQINELETKLKDSDNRVKTLTHELSKYENICTNNDKNLQIIEELNGKIQKQQELIDRLFTIEDVKNVNEVDTNSRSGVMELNRALAQLKTTEKESAEKSKRIEGLEQELENTRIGFNKQMNERLKKFGTNSLANSRTTVWTRITPKLNNHSTPLSPQSMSTSCSSFVLETQQDSQSINKDLIKCLKDMKDINKSSFYRCKTGLGGREPLNRDVWDSNEKSDVKPNTLMSESSKEVMANVVTIQPLNQNSMFGSEPQLMKSSENNITIESKERDQSIGAQDLEHNSNYSSVFGDRVGCFKRRPTKNPNKE